MLFNLIMKYLKKILKFDYLVETLYGPRLLDLNNYRTVVNRLKCKKLTTLGKQKCKLKLIILLGLLIYNIIKGSYGN